MMLSYHTIYKYFIVLAIYWSSAKYAQIFQKKTEQQIIKKPVMADKLQKLWGEEGSEQHTHSIIQHSKCFL